jgi:tape measure domain-containing protein
MAAEWEQTEIAFTTLLKSGEKARDFLEELDRFAAVTPFELPGLIDASRRLLAFGFQAEEVVPIMRSVGDAVAALGGGEAEIQSVIRALGQMRAKGKVTAEEMSIQLAEQGIPAWQYLADAIGVGIPDAMDKVSRGMVPAAVGIQAVLHGMTRDFGGAMEVQSRTLIGLWSTTKDQLGIITRATGQYLIEAFNIKGLVEGLGRALGSLADEIRRAATPAEGIRNILNRTFTPEVRLAVIALAGAVAGALVPAFLMAAKAIWSAALALAPFMIKGAAVALTAYVIYRAWADAGSGIAAVSVFMIRMVGAVVGVLGLLIPPLQTVSQNIFAYADSLAAASKAARETAKQSQSVADTANQMQQQQQAVANAGKDAASAQESLGKATEKAAKAAGKNIMAFDQVHRLQEDVSKAGAEAAAAMTLPEMAVPAVAAPTLPDVAEAAGPLDKLASRWDAVTAAMQRARPVIEMIGYVIAGVLLVHVGRLIVQLGTLAAASLATAARMAKAWAMSAAAAVASAAKQAVAFAVIAARWAWMGAKALFHAAKVAAAWFIALGPIGWVLGAIALVAAVVALNWDKIKAKTEEIWTAVSSFLVEKWETIKTWAAEKWESIKQIINNAVTATTDWLVEKWNSASSWLIEKWATINIAAKERWESVKNIISNKTESLAQWLSRRWDSISTALGSTWERIRILARDKWQGVKDIVRGVINSIIAFINRFIRFWNRIEFRVPEVDIPFVGTFGGWNVRVPQIQEIPHLAAGGVVAKPTLALLGEAGPEAVVPLRGAGAGHLADAVAQAVYLAVRDAVRINRVEQGHERQQEVVLEIDGARVGRAVLPAIIRESQRVGVSVIRPVGV